MKWRALLLAIASLVGVNRARATTITITIVGNIAPCSDQSCSNNPGTDTSGMWGFPAGTSLANQPFTLVFTFDDTLGTGSANLNSDPSYIWTQNGTYASPGTAMLTINSVQYPIGTRSGASSEAIEYTGGVYPGGTSDVPGVATYLASDGVTSVGASVEPTTDHSNLTWLAGTWETTIPFMNVVGQSTNSFNINVDTNHISSGRLVPLYLSVTGGSDLCEIPASESNTFDAWGVSALSYDLDDPDLGTFNVLLQTASSVNNNVSYTTFNGGMLEEYTLPPTGNTQPSDACYTEAKNQNPGITLTTAPATQVTGGASAASGNSNVPDNVGYGETIVQYYQTLITQANSYPCGYVVYQTHAYQCPAGGAWNTYGGTNTGGLNTLTGTILDGNLSANHVAVSRSGLPETHP